MSRSRRSVATFEYTYDNALTWLFAGLLLIALVAGLFEQLAG
jgi:hypothetical protein